MFFMGYYRERKDRFTFWRVTFAGIERKEFRVPKMPNVTLKQEASDPLSLTELNDALPPNPDQLESRRTSVPTCHDFVPPQPLDSQTFHLPYAQSYKPSSPTYVQSSYKPPTFLPSAQSYKPSSPSYNPFESQSCKPSSPSYEPTCNISFESLPPSPIPPQPIEPLGISYTEATYPFPRFQPPPPSSLVPLDHHGDEELFGQVGLHCYNLLNGTNLRFAGLDKYYRTGLFYKLIKFNAKDPISYAKCQFITRVVRSDMESKGCMSFITTQCRLLPDVEDNPCDFDRLAVDDFFKGDMPNSMPEDTCDNLQYYELKESEVEENKIWIYLYGNLAFYTELSCFRNSRLWRGPFKLSKVIVQTREDVESEKKAKAENAILYISIKAFNGQDAYSIIRRTTDGKPGHMSLEVKCLM